MSLVEICNSTYNHAPIESFGKKYFKHRIKDKIICVECMGAYLDEAAKTLAREIFKCVTNVDMQELTKTSDVDRTECYTFTYQKSLITDFMKFILPLTFELNISFTYDKIQKYMDTDYLDSHSISAVTNSPVTAIRIANARITSIVCDESYPKFYLSLDIRKNDSEEIIMNHIFQYLDRFVHTFFTEIPDIGVQSIMNKATTGDASYASSCATSAKAPECCNCNANVYSETYIYNSRVYCLNCMYEMVVQESINNNISDLVGLSDQITSSNYAIVNSTEWKRNVIDKYINAMTSLGVKPNITHYMMTCY